MCKKGANVCVVDIDKDGLEKVADEIKQYGGNVNTFICDVSYEQKKRGADIVKIVTAANSDEEQMENLRITTLLKKELKVPFLFLSGGTHPKIHRMIGVQLGRVTYLAVKEHDMQAGASGLASVVIPMAKTFGLRVVTTVISNPENIKHLGADLIVDTRTQNLPAVLKAEELSGRAIDIAIDCLGGQNLGDCLPYVKYGCRWIVIAALAGVNTTIDLKNIYKKNIRIVGSTLRSRTPEMKAQILSNIVREVWSKVESGEVKPTVYKVLPITEAEAAHDILYRGENVGKVVLKVQ